MSGSRLGGDLVLSPAWCTRLLTDRGPPEDGDSVSSLRSLNIPSTVTGVGGAGRPEQSGALHSLPNATGGASRPGKGPLVETSLPFTQKDLLPRPPHLEPL